MITIEGYEDHPLVDGTPFLDDGAFWPAYLAATTEVRDHRFLCESFDIDQNALHECYGRLADTARWPVFTVALSTGAQIVIVFRNAEGDAGTDFVLRSADRATALRWVRLDGHFLAPGLSWPELAAISARPGPGGVAGHRARMLLLLPATGDADLPAAAVPAVASALAAAGAAEHAAVPLAGELLGHPVGGTARWRRSKDGFTVCDAHSSRRNPACPAALSPGEMQFLSAAIDGENISPDT